MCSRVVASVKSCKLMVDGEERKSLDLAKKQKPYTQIEHEHIGTRDIVSGSSCLLVQSCPSWCCGKQMAWVGIEADVQLESAFIQEALTLCK